VRVLAAAEEYQMPLHFARLLLHTSPAMASLRCRSYSFHSQILCYASTKGKVILELEDHVRKLEKAVKEGRCVRVFANFSKFRHHSPQRMISGHFPFKLKKPKIIA
jgi:hypothetical protein